MENEPKPIEEVRDKPDSWWYKVYLLVIVTTIVVISGLAYLSYHFSGGGVN